MKRLLVLAMFFTSLRVFSQIQIESYSLQITFNKTSNIIFPYAIKSVDRGSKDLLVQKAKGAENVLQLKAAKPNFSTTNLTVITTDGKLYPFTVKYDSDPALLNLSFSEEPLVQLYQAAANEALLDSIAKIVLHQQPCLRISTNREGIRLVLKNIFIHEHILWFRFCLENNSEIDYQPGYTHFFIQDKHRAKRTPLQETAIKPLNRVLHETVAGNNQKEFAIAFKQFTMPREKRLVCQLSEEDGGRLLSFPIRHRAILKAKALYP